MFGQQIVSSLDKFLKGILNIAWLNLLWIFSSLLGLFIAGVFPATVASLAVARKWVRKEEMTSVLQYFRKVYKEEFVRSNIIGWILMAIGLILFVNYRTMIELGNQIPIFVVFAYYLVLFFYSLVLVWIFPLITHYHTTIKQYFKNAFIIGMSKLPFSLAIFAVIFLICYVSLELPSMFVFITFGLTAITMMFFVMQVFNKIDEHSYR